MARAKRQRLANSRADRAARYSLYSLAKMDNTAAPQPRELDALGKLAMQPFLLNTCQYRLVLAQN